MHPMTPIEISEQREYHAKQLQPVTNMSTSSMQQTNETHFVQIPKCPTTIQILLIVPIENDHNCYLLSPKAFKSIMPSIVSNNDFGTEVVSNLVAMSWRVLEFFRAGMKPGMKAHDT